MRRTVLLLTAVCALALPAVAHADPVPAIAQEWPLCGVAPDDDGHYCIVSMTKNGSAISAPPSGTWQRPYVDLIGGGDVRFGVLQETVGSPSSTGDVPPGDDYVLVVNTGSIKPRELFGHVRNATFARGGGPLPAGYTFTLGFEPTPIAWRTPFDSCVVGSCGGSALEANLVYDGFVTGYVTDLAGSGLDADEVSARAGYVHAYNAQDATMPFYDFDTNSLVIRLANPHWRSPGVVATGSYQTFLPNAMLIGVMNVPDPSSLTGGSLVVDRTVGDTTTAVSFTLTHTADGVEIQIPSITYSSPTYRIKVKRTPPGPPRLRSVARATRTSIRVRFRRPLANGGAPVTKYVARCRKPGGVWHTAAARQAPIVVTRLPRTSMHCSVRAVNRIGKGPFSAERVA